MTGSRPTPRTVIFATLALAACGRGEDKQASDRISQTTTGTQATAADDTRIPCATGKAALTPTCTFSRERTPAGLVVTIQREDGAFRRLLVTRDGHGVIAADGAQPARVSVVGEDQIEVALGDDRYRLPATIRAGAR